MYVNRENYKRLLWRAAVTLFVLLVPVFLITTSVRWVINAPFLYSYGFDRYRIADYTGIERDELISAGRQIRDYFNNDEELLQIRVMVNGIRVASLYNEREVIHMRDVKDLVRDVYAVQLLVGFYLLVVIGAGFYLCRRAFWGSLGRYATMGGGLTLGLVVLVGLASIVGFDQLFLVFHLISFSNDFWQLDPRRDYLIAMFPQGFFFDATMLIALSTIIAAALLVAVPFAVRKSRSEKTITRAQRRMASRK